MKLVRFAYMPDQTLGRLFIPDLGMFCTVERPWLSNQPWRSCIPEGEYEWATSTFHRNDDDPTNDYPCLEVVSVPGRTLIKAHRANWASELNGCIAPGTEWKANGEEIGVGSSTVALNRIMEYYPGDMYGRLRIEFDPAHKGVWRHG